MATATTCVGLMGLAVPAVSPAPVAPKDCGYVTVGGKRLNVRADQLRCKDARPYARRYESDGGKPSGFACTDYGSGTAIEFICSKGVKRFIAIRR